MRTLIFRIFPILVAMLFMSAMAIAKTWYVKPDGSGDAPTIQAGIDSSATADTVLLADGTYTGIGNRDIDGRGKSIVIRSESGDPYLCIIDCEGTSFDFHRGFYFHSGKYFEFPFTNRVGGTFNKYYDPLKTVFRGECVLTIDDPMSDTVAMDRTYERETFQYMLGIDRPTSIPWLNRTRTFFISAQFFQKYILNHNDHMMDASPGGTTTDSYQTVISLLINTGYRWDTINPQIIFAYNFTGEGSINPQCEFVVGNNWRFGGGIQILMSHNQKEPYFGGIRHNDQIYVWAKYQFN